MKIIAKFIGEDGSRGFRKNDYYSISITVEKEWLLVRNVEGYQSCPYDNMDKLLSNWRIVEYTK